MTLTDGRISYRVEVRVHRDANGWRRKTSVTVASYQEALALEAERKVEAKAGAHVAARS